MRRTGLGMRWPRRFAAKGSPRGRRPTGTAPSGRSMSSGPISSSSIPPSPTAPVSSSHGTSRAAGGTPILIVTRAKTVEDRVAGLEVADDYVLKPADPFEVVRFFLLNPRRVVSKAEIQDAVWGDTSSDDASTVETYVSYLRKKLDRLGPPLIQTVRLVGYVLRES